MPNSGRKGKTQTRRQLNGQRSLSDFTVNDYANAEPSAAKSGRLSKSSLNSFVMETKQLTGSKVAARDSLAWYERDLSDFELTDEEPDHNDEVEALGEGVLLSTRNRRRKKLWSGRREDEGRVFSVHLWVVIGDWIHPEDISRFAAVCQGSHVVTHTARFWLNMYKRHYRTKATLPDTLLPVAMSRVHGLRARVVRSLYLMYQSFQQRLRTLVAFENDPDCLKGSTCTLMWFQQIKTHWHFFFKFKLHSHTKSSCPLVRKNKRPSILDDPDIHDNPESNNCVLHIVTLNFIPLPPAIMGQVLANSSLSVGHGMRYHKMKLTFTSQQYAAFGSKHFAGGTTIVMDPVLNAYVLNWWDPKYPHQPV